MAQRDRPFRVVIVGGGIAGLFASNCLQKLGIDHIVLEKHAEVASPVGAGISMWPQTMRILHQLGIADTVKRDPNIVPVNRYMSRGSDGILMHDNLLYTHIQENHGSGFYAFERSNFLQILYDALPDKSFVKTGVAIKNIIQSEDGVTVQLRNGDVETGDMVIGCDGIYSDVRRFMWDHATKTSPGLVTAKEKTSMKTAWKALILTTPKIPELGDRDVTVTHNDGFMFFATSQPNIVAVNVIFRLDKPFTWPKRERYTDEDIEVLAELVADKPVSNGLLFSDIWKRRQRATIVSLEEGVLKHFHHGRICLIGDAAHKVHPNLALGGNLAIEGVASLMNNLNSVMQTFRGSKPSGTALNMAFAAYQREQRQRAKELMDISNAVAKMQSYSTLLNKILAYWILPALDDSIIANIFGGYIANSTTLNFLPCEGFPSGRISWVERRVDENFVQDKIVNQVTEISIAA